MAFVCDSDIYQRWLKELSDAGLIPPEVRRIIIDLSLDEPAMVYFECFADERMFAIDAAKLVGDGAHAISVTEAAGKDGAADIVTESLIEEPEAVKGED